MPVWIECLLAVAIVSAIPLASAVVLFVDPTIVRRAVPVLVRLAIGLIGFGLLDQIFDRLSSDRRIVWLNFIGDTFHNGVDGVLIAASFLANPSLGIVATLAVSLHELPRELGSLGIFIHGGLTPKRAYGLNALTGLAALAGAAVTLLLGLRAR